mmetsp:Transcript_46840/g.62009  ORF Transcript_46840/g.62009 Transcript_46840/m.62009 type:complete len:124 (-) Transcript_46840:1428-1799(-)
MQNDLLVLGLVEHGGLADFAPLLNENLIDFEFDGLPLNDFFFHAVLCDQPVHEHVLALPDTVSSVHRLQVDLRVPVRVVQHYMVRRHQVDTEAACASRDQKDYFIGARPREVLNPLLSVGQLS